MSLKQEQIEEIKNILTKSIKDKFSRYNPETSNMPFHTRLLGKDRLALYSFIHSLNTAFGTSIFEPVSIAIAKTKFKKVEKQYKAGQKISSEAQIVIQNIIDGLSSGISEPNKKEEIERIREVARKGSIKEVKFTKVDIYLLSKENEHYLIDLKSAKPNIGEFKGYKRTLLEWVASILLEDDSAKINTLIAIPYNPYEPEPYQRWTMKGMLDLDKELKVADEFWDFLGEKNTYNDLLGCFETVGIEMREEIDNYFKNFTNRK